MPDELVKVLITDFSKIETVRRFDTVKRIVKTDVHNYRESIERIFIFCCKKNQGFVMRCYSVAVKFYYAVYSSLSGHFVLKYHR